MFLERPILRLEVCNPRLLAHVEDLREVKAARTRLRSMLAFVSSCRLARESALLTRCTRLSVVSDVDLYSLQNLIDVRGMFSSLAHTQTICSCHTHTHTHTHTHRRDAAEGACAGAA